MPAPEEVVAARWSRRQARCHECGTVYEATSCPSCGDRPDGAPVAMIGVVTETPDGAARLSLVEDLDGRQITRATRTLNAEQLRWLRRRTGHAGQFATPAGEPVATVGVAR